MRKSTFFARHALLVLVIVFFCVPFALRGARMAVQGMKNDVKDWLPKDFAETAELDWFRKHFISEQFVVVSWDGCHGDADDERFKLFLAKLAPETPPSQLAREPEAEDEIDPAVEAATPPASDEPIAAEPPTAVEIASVSSSSAPPMPGVPAPLPTVEPESSPDAKPSDVPQAIRYLHRENKIGDYYGLYLTSDLHENWGGKQEKWLRGLKREVEGSLEEAWFYITPEGDLYRWDGVDSPIASAVREAHRRYSGPSLSGTLIHSYGEIDGPWYYAEPRRLRAQLFKTITTGPDVLASMTGPGGELEDDPQEAQKRLSGTLFGPDGKQTSIILTLTDAAKRNLHLVLGRGVLGKPRGLLYKVAEQTNIAENELRLGGPPVDNVAIDEEGSITLFRLVGLCAILGIGLSLICFRSISATIMVFFIGAISAVASLAFVWWGGSSVDAILMSMPALVYVLGLSGSAHIMNYYQDAIDEHGYEGAPERAVRHGWKPALLCNITTAIGLASLYTSELIPIQKFGIFSAIGVMATLLVLFTYMPAALQIWPQKQRKKPAPGSNQEAGLLDKYLNGFWERLARSIIRHNLLVAGGCVLVIVVVGYGVTRMQTSVNMLRMFHKEAKIIRDYEWLEANIGELVPMEIVLRVDKRAQLPPAAERAEQDEVDPESTFQLPFLERMELASRVQHVLEKEFGPQGKQVVGQAMSAATFVRELPEPKGDTRTLLVRGGTNNRLEAHRNEFLHSDYLRIDDDGSELWRVSLRVGATKGVDYGMLVNELRQAVEPVLAAQREREEILRELVALRQGKHPAGAKVLLVGVPQSLRATADEAAEQAAVNPAAEAVAETDAGAEHAIDQAQIFTSTLNDLLAVSRLKVNNLLAAEAAPADWAQTVAGYDCVVIVGPRSEAEIAEIRQHAKLVIDSRDHSHPTNSLAIPGITRGATGQPPAVAAVYTGVVPIVYKAQRTLLESLIESTFWSVITITPLLMFIARNVWAGLVAMLPNVLPVLMVFGGMGWLGIDVDVGSMMTASIALGVAVDDTIHYLNWFREELDRVGDRKTAILGAYRHCATPTVQAAVMSGLGLSIFAISTFTPTQRFGYLMLAILWLGVVAELIFFPALLAGPLGAAFKPRKKKGTDASHTGGHGTTTELVSPMAVESEMAETAGGSGLASGMHGSTAKANILRSLRHDSSHRHGG